MHEIDSFTDYLRTRGYAQSTRDGYRSLLKDFERFLATELISDIRQVTEKTAYRYIQQLSTRQSGATAFNSLGKLRHFFGYLVNERVLFYSPVEHARLPRLRPQVRRIFSTEKMRRLLDSIRLDGPLHIRTKAILELAYSSALRPGEVRNLKIEDIDFAAGLLFIEQSKNRKDRLVPVGKAALGFAFRYLDEVRPHFLSGNKHSYLFISHRGGGKLSASGFWRGIEATMKACGLSSIRPHSIRASAATSLLEAGMHIGYIAELLGHAELSTTQVYLRIKQRRLEEQLSEKHPRNGFKLQNQGVMI